jgi:hypothetical protein
MRIHPVAAHSVRVPFLVMVAQTLKEVISTSTVVQYRKSFLQTPLKEQL